MAEPCFNLKNSNPPACGVHNVPLIEQQSSENPKVSMFGDFTFFVCPVRGYVVNNSAPQRRSPD